MPGPVTKSEFLLEGAIDKGPSPPSGNLLERDCDPCSCDEKGDERDVKKDEGSYSHPAIAVLIRRRSRGRQKPPLQTDID